MPDIDFVITWVDGSDPAWREQYKQFSGGKEIQPAHYRDYGTLKYWFRSVEKYAPWVRNIWFVTCGQLPGWLNTDNPRLRRVNHSDFMPEAYLPTFSANAIELNLHRIEGISENFVYFNDDTFITAPVTEADFFKNGLPCDSAVLAALIPSVKNEVITHILFNDLLLINANFNKRNAMKGNYPKWLSLKYGKNIFKTLYYLLIGKFSGFDNPHLPNSFLKSTFEEVWKAEPDFLDKTCRNRFRTNGDVNQYLMRYWQLAEGKFSPRSPKTGANYCLGENKEEIEKQIKARNKKLICINDNSQIENIDEEMKWLSELFAHSFPEKSSFEI